MKKILLTTLNPYASRTDVDFFFFRDKNGQIGCCNGIAVAEAGAKQILASEPMDEIIVFSDPRTIFSGDEPERVTLRDKQLPLPAELQSFSEFSFFCYRIQQFLLGLDIEANDISELMPSEEGDRILKLGDTLYRKHFGAQKPRLAFLEFCRDPERKAAFLKEASELLQPRQLRWLLHGWYRKLDNIYKMHPLDANRDVSISFIPALKNDANRFDLQNLNRNLSEYFDRLQEDVTLYTDLQGLDFADAFSFYNILLALGMKTERRAILAKVLRSTSSAELLIHPIVEETDRIRIRELLSAIETFRICGKAQPLADFWEKRRLRDPHISRMLIGLQYIDEGASLCNIPVLKYGIQIIRQVFLERDEAPARESDFFYSLFSSIIRSDFGPLLEADEVDIPELLNWTIRKKLYQQALTIVEAQVPEDLVQRGIFCYARNPEDAERVLEEFNLLYWNENPRNRYTYNDLSHFFIKNYGRHLVNFRVSKDQLNRDFAHLRIRQLHGQTDMIPAYTNTAREDLLFEVLYNYYGISHLRNEVCHAVPPENALPGGSGLIAPKNMDTLCEALNRFAQIYSDLCRHTPKDGPAPYRISPDQFRGYTRLHRLEPLELDNDDILEQNVSFNFNGSELTLRLRMLRPIEDPFAPEHPENT